MQAATPKPAQHKRTVSSTEAGAATVGAHPATTSSSSPPTDDRIAIIGMSALLPSGQNIYESWESIRNGLDHISDVPHDRLDVTAYYHPEKALKDHIYCKRGGFIPEFEFDPREYGMNLLQVEDADANQTLTLLKVKEALSDAHIHPFSKEPRRIGCVLGIGGGQKASHEFYSRLNFVTMQKVLLKMGMPEEDVEAAIEKYKANFPEWRLDSFPGFLGNVTAGRVTNAMNLTGMNCVVDAACASSLTALKVAIDEILHGDCSTMVVGATCTDNSLGMYFAFSQTPVFSTDQQVKAYDESTKGMLIGEGSVMLVIKRFADAVADGDKIHAVVRGVASSSDGKAPGIYVPTVTGQEECIKRAWNKCGLDPKTATLVEGHGTGTPVGDKIELTGLRNVFSAHGAGHEQIAVGSVKSQIGHLKAVAGMAGIVKVVLALKHKTLPMSINVKIPPTLADKEHTRIQDTCLYINTKNRPWFVDPSIGVRRAGLSSFGFGGANYHCVIEEYENEHQGAYRYHEMPVPCVMGAASVKALVAEARQVAADIATQLARTDLASPKDRLDEAYEVYLAFTKKHQVGASGFPLPPQHPRFGLLAKDVQSLASDLTLLCDAAERPLPNGEVEVRLRPDLIYRSRGIDTRGKVAALFAGQGSQYVNMYEDVAMNWPEFRSAVVAMDRASSQVCGVRTSAFMYPRNPYANETADLTKKQEAEISTIQNAQLAIVAASVGAYSVFSRAGFKPDFVAGHSLGEYPALYAGGALELDELAELVCARAHAMQNAPQVDDEPGRMVAVVGEGAENVRPEAEGVWLANCNSPTQIVLTGTEKGVAADSKRLTSAGFRVVALNTGGAFHSPRMAPAERVFNQRLAAARILPLTHDGPRAYSNVSGGVYPTGDAEAVRKSLAKQMTSSVQFVSEIRAMHKDGARVFVEFGPKNVLGKLVSQILGNDAEVFSISLNPSTGKSADAQMREAALQCAVIGVPFTEPFDPWGVRNPFKGLAGYFNDVEAERKARASKTKLKLSAATFVSKKTLAERQRIMNDGKLLSCFVRPPSASSQAAAMSEELARLRSQLEDAKTEARNAKLEAERYRAEGASSSSSTSASSSSGSGAGGASGELSPAQLLKIETLLKSYEDINKQIKSVLMGHNITVVPPVGIPAATRAIASTASSSSSTASAAPKPAASSSGSSSSSSGIPKETVIKTMNKLLAETTGFDAELISNEMSLEDDLGIDSIKRVELTSSASAALKVTVSDEAMTALSRARTVGEVVEVFVAHVGTGGATVATPAASPRSTSSSSNGTGISKDVVVKTMNKLLAETTGFDADLISNEMSLEDDLGIDSIKRVELTSSASAALKITVSDEAMTALSRARTVGEVVEVFVAHVGGGGSSAPAAPAPPVSTPAAAPKTQVPALKPAASSSTSTGGVSKDLVVKTMNKLLADTTGFDAELISNEMSLEDDLGIDSIKRVELTSSASAALKITVSDEAMTALSRARTVGEVVDVFIAHVGGSSAPSAPVVPASKPAAPAAPVASSSSASSSSGISKDVVVKTMNKLLSDTTGFDAELISNEMSLEDDLGIDSIKRVELTSSASAALKITVSDEAMTALSRARTVGEVVDVFIAHVGGSSAPAAPVMPASKPAAPSAPVAPASKPAAPVASTSSSGISKDTVVKTMNKLLSDTTGFDAELISNEMSLEDDLGIDSIKRVELTSSASAALKITVSDEAMTALSRARTVGEVVDVFIAHVGGASSSAPAAVTVAPTSKPAAPSAPFASSSSSSSGISKDVVVKTMNKLLSDTTGFDAELISNEMSLEDDLGIDSIKRVELTSSASAALKITVSDEAMTALSRARTVGEVVDVFIAHVGGSSAPAPAPAPALAAPAPPQMNGHHAKPAPAPTSSSSGISKDTVVKTMNKLLSDTTGFDAELISNEMSLEDDLGIDSIKRVELTSSASAALKITVSDEAMTALSRARTVGEVVDVFIAHVGGGGNNSAAPAAPTPSTSQPSAPASMNGISKDLVVKTMNKLLSDTTGFDADLISNDMSLEDDLGIDSIKRVELTSSASSALKVTVSDEAMTALSRARTVGEVIEVFLQHAATSSSSSTAPSTKQQPASSSSTLSLRPAGCEHLSLSYATVARLPKPDKLILDRPASRPILIVDDGKSTVAAKLAAKLGACAVIVTFAGQNRSGSSSNLPTIVLPDASEAAFQAAVAGMSSPPGGLVYLPASSSQEDDPVRGSVAKQNAWLMLAAKTLKPALADTPIPNGRCTFLAVTRMDGKLGLGPDFGKNANDVVSEAEKGALFGLTKTLTLEWPHTFCRGVDLAAKMDDDACVAALLAELSDPDLTIREVGYVSATERYTTRAGDLAPAPSADAREVFTPKDVWIVTGGARGITPVCVYELAKASRGGKYLLLGRSKLNPEPAWAAGKAVGKPLEDAALAFIKMEIAAGRLNEKPTPKLIKQYAGQVEATREVEDSLRLIRSVAGASADYYPCDVSDAAAVAKLIATHVSRDTPVTGILHASGVLRDKAIQNKTAEDFEAVYGTKVYGLRAVLRAVPAGSLKHLVVFSSLAGFHGNRGQADYALANEVLNKAAWAISRRHPSCRARALDFGPWSGGMVTDALKKMFESQGVQIIPRESGAECVARVLSLSGETQCLFGNWGVPAVAPLAKSWVIIREAVFDKKSNGFLDSHVVKGKRVLPFTIASQELGRIAAVTHPGFFLHSVKDVQLFRGLVGPLDDLNPVTVRMELHLHDQAPNGNGDRVTVDCELFTTHNDKVVPSYRCLALLEPAPKPQMVIPGLGGSLAEGGQKGGLPANRDLYDNKMLFHGPDMRTIQHVLRVTEEDALAKCRRVPVENEGQFPAAGPVNGYITDTAFQLALIWARELRNAGSLPNFASSIEFVKEVPVGANFYCLLTRDASAAAGGEVQKGNATVWKSQFYMFNAAGEVYVMGRISVVLNEGLTWV